MKKITGILCAAILLLFISNCSDAPAFLSVTYNANGADSGTVPEDSSRYSAGESVSVAGNTGDLARTGYTFIGWNISSDGSGITYQQGDTFNISDNIVLYADWEATPGIIRVSYASGEVADGDTVDLGIGVVSVSQDVVFTIESDKTVTLGDSAAGVNEDTAPYWFSILAQPANTVSPSNSTSFTLRCTPQNEGDKTASVTVYFNGSDFFMINLTASATAFPEPEIRITKDSATILDNYSASFGYIPINTFSDVVFTIMNEGNADLVLNGEPLISISGTDETLYTIQSNPDTPVTAGGETYFTIRFQPDSTGSKYADLSIANNDSDENPYNFQLSGSGVTVPEINLKLDAEDIISGGSGVDFGAVMTGESSDLVFTIENTGSGALTLSGSPKVSLSGNDPGEFEVTIQPASPVAAEGGTSSFTIRFSPLTEGSKSAEVSIANNDSDENPYTFTIAGTAEAWHGTRTVDAADDVGLWASLALYHETAADTLFISYYDETNADLKVARSYNGGVTWETMTVADYDNQGQYSSIALSSTGTSVFISYWNLYGNDCDFIQSYDSGDNWYSRQIETTGTVGMYSALTVASDSKLYAAYYDSTNDDLKFAKSVNGGVNWLAEDIRIIDSGTTVGRGISLCDITDWVYVSYIKENTYDVLFSKSYDSGATWSTPVVAHDITISAISPCTSLAVYGDTTYYIAYAYSSVLGFVKSTDSGVTWSAETIIDYCGTTYDNCMSLKASGNTLHLAYFDGTDIMYTKSTDGGSSWSTPVTVHAGADYTNAVSLAFSGDTIYIAYHDGTSGVKDLCIAKSIDGGIYPGLKLPDRPGAIIAVVICMHIFTPMRVSTGNYKPIHPAVNANILG